MWVKCHKIKVLFPLPCMKTVGYRLFYMSFCSQYCLFIIFYRGLSQTVYKADL